jgi:hypothetical protein
VQCSQLETLHLTSQLPGSEEAAEEVEAAAAAAEEEVDEVEDEVEGVDWGHVKEGGGHETEGEIGGEEEGEDAAQCGVIRVLRRRLVSTAWVAFLQGELLSAKRVKIWIDGEIATYGSSHLRFPHQEQFI